MTRCDNIRIETMTIRPLNNPQIPNTGQCEPCLDVFDGKIFFVTTTIEDVNQLPQNEVWSYDLGIASI